MAATTGLVQFSIFRQASGSEGCCGGLPNSRMSAPAMKLRPAPTISTALAALSASAASMAATRPRRTSTPRALTGGLSMVTTNTSPWRAKVTGPKDVEGLEVVVAMCLSLAWRTLRMQGTRRLWGVNPTFFACIAALTIA
jgi:hypothetical protein